MLQFGIGLNTGLKRSGKKNQDAVCVVNRFSNSPLMILADGMGGYQGGEIASRIVIDTFKKNYKRRDKNFKIYEFLLDTISLSHKKIISTANSNRNLAKMGSTVVAVVVDQKRDQIHIANVGDSRAYLISKYIIQQISFDHSEVAELKRSGSISDEEAINYHRKNVLTMSLSASRTEDSVKPYINTFDFPNNSAILICSDGLWGPVADTLIQLAVLEFHPKKAAEQLIKIANLNGGPDNISVLIARRFGEWRKYKKVHSRDLEDTH